MKILRIINRFNLGGPTFNAAYLTRFLPSGYETRLIGGSPLREEEHSGFILKNLGVDFTELKAMNRAVRFWEDVQAYREISGIIQEYRPDIVHTHAAKAGALGRFAAWRNGVPIIVHTFHGNVFAHYFGKLKTGLVKRTERFLASRSDAIVAISDSQKNQLVNIHRICPEKKVTVIPLGLDLARFDVQNEKRRELFRNNFFVRHNELALGIIGRFAPVKNHRLFFEALKIVATDYPEIKFKAFVIGDGMLKPDLLDACSPLRTAQAPDENAQVIFTSWIKDIEHVLPALDCVVLTSLNEGTPVSLIEAQAASVAVISTNAGGAQDCFLDKRSGILLRSFEPAELASAIKSIHDPQLRIGMGQCGYRFSNERFGYQRLVNDMHNLYQQLASQKLKT